MIAGSGRGAGKTAVGCALMAAMPEMRWVAVKATPHVYGTGEGIWEETNPATDKDTERYLSAGARRAFLATGGVDSQAKDWAIEARKRASECDAVLVESNRITAEAVARPNERTVCLAVLTGPEATWKASLTECLGRADALVLAGVLASEEFTSPLLRKPVFRLAPGQWSVPELVRFVRAQLLLAKL